MTIFSAWRFTFFICAVVLCGCQRPPALASQSSKAPAPTISTRPVYAPIAAKAFAWKRVDHYGSLSTELRSLEVAVFDDGTIIWSDSAKHFGAPYRIAKLTPQAIEALRGVFARDAASTLPDDNSASVGPDSDFSIIAYDLGPALQMERASWHEIFEGDPRLAVTDKGVEALEGRKKDAVLAAASPGYQRFRAHWSQLSLALQQAIPPAGDVIDPAQIQWK